MHSQNGNGIAQNYMALTNSISDSTGTGSMMNLGFLYVIALSDILPSYGLPEVKLSLFGLVTKAKFDLPPQHSALITLNGLTQVKVGADLTIIPKNWVSIMVRGDQVNYDQNHGGYVFAAFTGRLSLFSHYLSGECIYLQYSHYIYGDHMVLDGTWPWGTVMVNGSDITQAYVGAYVGKKPDADVIKLQAQVKF
jgi:hypothetical protein